jgi:hypothetical protein
MLLDLLSLYRPKCLGGLPETELLGCLIPGPDHRGGQGLGWLPGCGSERLGRPTSIHHLV